MLFNRLLLLLLLRRRGKVQLSEESLNTSQLAINFFFMPEKKHLLCVNAIELLCPVTGSNALRTKVVDLTLNTQQLQLSLLQNLLLVGAINILISFYN